MFLKRLPAVSIDCGQQINYHHVGYAEQTDCTTFFATNGVVVSVQLNLVSSDRSQLHPLTDSKLFLETCRFAQHLVLTAICFCLST